jgi:hypothetical protein
VYFSFISTRNIGAFIINSKKLFYDFKENIAMTVFLKMKRMTVLWKILAQNLNQTFCKTYKYVTKEAAEEHTDIIGEDFMTFWRKPLQNSYDIHLKETM